MTTRTRIALTAASALYLLVMLAGLLCLASILPGVWALLSVPLMAVNGFMVSDWLGMIWQLEGQYDDGTV